MQRGDRMTNDAGTTGRYVGTSPHGVVWVEWDGDAAAYARMCAAFDRLYGSREPQTDDAPGTTSPPAPRVRTAGISS